MKVPFSFGSDNHAGIHPDVLDAITHANRDDASAYGDDPWTEEFNQLILKTFANENGPLPRGFPVWNGTAANILGLSMLVKSHQAVICSTNAHIAVDECGAPEKHLGSKLILVNCPPHTGAKLTPELIAEKIVRIGDQHAVQPKVVSLTQSTEYGCVYTPAEIRAISALCKSRGLFLHMDGARISNAAAFLNLSLKEISNDCGVDVLSLGGTKNGLMGAEAVILFNETIQNEFTFHRKQGMQLASKMRFLSAQLMVFLTNDFWKKNALHANSMAKRLEANIEDLIKNHGLPIKITQKVEANAVFLELPKTAAKKVQARFPFYIWDERGAQLSCEARLMTHFRTEATVIDQFTHALKEACT